MRSFVNALPRVKGPGQHVNNKARGAPQDTVHQQRKRTMAHCHQIFIAQPLPRPQSNRVQRQDILTL